MKADQVENTRGNADDLRNVGSELCFEDNVTKKNKTLTMDHIRRTDPPGYRIAKEFPRLSRLT